MPAFRVFRGFEYSYIHHAPQQPTKGYVLFLHGWPSVGQEWHHQLSHFRHLGYGVVGPDLLGSGYTSRPSTVESYLLKDIAQDVIEILDHEGIRQVYAVGHDWGSHLLGRLAVYFPERIKKQCFIAVGYRPPGDPVSIDAINERTKEVLGYPAFGYQVFFTRHERAEEILNQHQDSMMSLIYSEDSTLWKKHLAPLGALQAWLEADKQAPWGTYLNEEDHKLRRETTSEALGGLPTLAWYKANAWNLNYEAERGISQESKSLKQPTLFLACERDCIAVPETQIGGMQPWIPNLEIRSLNSSHWAALELPSVVNQELERFFII